jgi:hypothetical protein
MVPHSSWLIPTQGAGYLAQELATQPVKVHVYNMMWLFSHADGGLFAMHLDYAWKKNTLKLQ